jgi:hypothetical protein
MPAALTVAPAWALPAIPAAAIITMKCTMVRMVPPRLGDRRFRLRRWVADCNPGAGVSGLDFSPVKASTSAHLRGDDTRAGPDYTVEHDWSAYTSQEHALCRRLYERRSKLVARDTAPDFTPLYARPRKLPALDPSAK